MINTNNKVPVALIFFNRPTQLKQVFESVKKYKPNELFLIQDGPRDGHESDVKNIEECRAIVENIDWNCKVYKNYSDKNLKTGKRIYSGISWAFEYTDRLIILEDDCLPSHSFYSFCEEILEKYLSDPRVGMISGMNHLESFDTIPYDYLFASVGSIAGWATWKRSWETIDYNMNYLNDENIVRLLSNYFKHNNKDKNLINRGLKLKSIVEKGGQLTSWSYQRGINDFLNSALIVVPKYNLMSNIGISDEGVHTPNDIRKVPKQLQKLYKLKLYEMKFPIKHPEYIIEDIEYNYRVDKMMKPKGIVKIIRKLESLFRRIIFCDFKSYFSKCFIRNKK